jgi:hypothetical protein
MENRWNDIDCGISKELERILSQYHLIYKKSHVDWAGTDTGLRGWRSATNSLSHCTALKKTPSHHYKNKNFKNV